MPWSASIVLVALWPLGLLGAYLGDGVAPTLLLGALTVVMLRGIQARWLVHEEQRAALPTPPAAGALTTPRLESAPSIDPPGR